MKTLRKGLAIILSLALVITLVPGMSSKMDTKAAEIFSITSPTANQLVAAGYIDIEWEAATNGTVSNYDVYIDEVKVTTTKSTSYEYYTTKVKAFDVYVKANYSNGTSETADTITFGVSKKGLGLASDMGANLNLRAMGVAWYYNWGESPSSGNQYTGIEYVPMVWKETNANNFKSRVERAKNRGYKYILTFNEPDLQGQCDMPVNDVYNVWKGINNMEGIKISSPVTAQWPQASGNWFQPFMTKIDENGDYQPDFISIHCYPDNYGGAGMASWFLENVVDWAWEKYGLPIWITEFSTTGSSITATGGNGTKEFWENVMPGLDSREYVERYAAFGFNSSTTGLWLYNTGELTPGGVIYSQLGNPAGFTAATPEDGDFTVKRENRNTLLDSNKTINGVTCEDYVNASGVSASSNSEIGNGGLASLAIDDNVNSRWESKHGIDDVYITIDLGATKNIKEIDILWEAASASKYDIEFSVDGNTWEKVVEGALGNGGRCDLVTLKNQVNARYVRIQGVERSTDYGYSIFDIAIYGTDDEKVDETTTVEIPTIPTTAPPTTTKNWLDGTDYHTYQGNREFINGLGNWSVYLSGTHKVNIATYPDDRDHLTMQLIDNGGNIGTWTFYNYIEKGGLVPGETYTMSVDIKGSTTNFSPGIEGTDGIVYYNKDMESDTVTVEITCVADANGKISGLIGLGKTEKTMFIDISNVVVRDSNGNIVETTDSWISPETTAATQQPTVAPQETTVEPTTTEISGETTTVSAPAKAKIKKASKKLASKKMKVNIKKVKGAKGYQIAVYKTKKNAKKNKKAIFKKIIKNRVKTVSKAKLKNKKKLYIRVRAYKLNGKKKVWGKWSNVKKVKVK